MKKYVWLKMIEKYRGLSSSARKKILWGLGLGALAFVMTIGLSFYLVASLLFQGVDRLQSTQVSIPTWSATLTSPQCWQAAQSLLDPMSWLQKSPLEHWQHLQLNCLQ
ncbi:MAG: hypothetical protein LW875_05190, partial [Proteobacteria bacterium]|nr:hypothetical protein [Pseudomonadota bacterium]